MSDYLVLGSGKDNKSPAHFTDFLQAMEYAHGLHRAGIPDVRVYLEACKVTDDGVSG